MEFLDGFVRNHHSKARKIDLRLTMHCCRVIIALGMGLRTLGMKGNFPGKEISGVDGEGGGQYEGFHEYFFIFIFIFIFKNSLLICNFLSGTMMSPPETREVSGGVKVILPFPREKSVLNISGRSALRCVDTVHQKREFPSSPTSPTPTPTTTPTPTPRFGCDWGADGRSQS